MYRLLDATRDIDRLIESAMQCTKVPPSLTRQLGDVATRSSKDLASITRTTQVDTEMTKAIANATTSSTALTAATRATGLPASLAHQIKELSGATDSARALIAATDPLSEVKAATSGYVEDVTARTHKVSDFIDQILVDPLPLFTDHPPNDAVGSFQGFNKAINRALAETEWQHLGSELSRLTDDLVTHYRQLVVPSSRAESLFGLGSLPAVSVYAHTTFLDGLSHLGVTAPSAVEDEEAEQAEEASFLEELVERSHGAIARLLMEYDPSLLELYVGAEEAIRNEHCAPMKFCALQRVILKRLILKEASDEAVLAWDSDRKYVSQRDERTPSMSGRIAYLCECAHRSEYTQFVTSDVRAVIAIWKELNRVAHQVPVQMTSTQMMRLRLRSNGLIITILQLAREVEN